MGEFTDKIKGAADVAMGKAKSAIGDVLDNPRLEAEGEIQQLKGKGEQLTGSIKGALGDKV